MNCKGIQAFCWDDLLLSLLRRRGKKVIFNTQTDGNFRIHERGLTPSTTKDTRKPRSSFNLDCRSYWRRNCIDHPTALSGRIGKTTPRGETGAVLLSTSALGMKQICLQIDMSPEVNRALVEEREKK